MNESQKYLLEEFVESHQQQRMSRRELVRRAVLMMGGIAAAATALRQAEHSLAAERSHINYAELYAAPLSKPQDAERGALTMPPPAQTSTLVVALDDPAIRTEFVTFAGEAGPIRAYLARPAADGVYPGVVVIHENRGLVEPNLDIARRFAKEGFAVIAPDLLSRVGGTDQFQADLAQATAAIGQLGPNAPVTDGNSAATYLLSQPFVSGKVGATGYCFGGGVTWRMGFRNPQLTAIVPFYGPTPPLDEAKNLQAAALGIYGENDTRITGESPMLADKLTEAGKTFEFWVAPGAGHAFFNNTIPVSSGPNGYQPEDAREAWLRTLAWFDRFLS